MPVIVTLPLLRLGEKEIQDTSLAVHIKILEGEGPLHYNKEATKHGRVMQVPFVTRSKGAVGRVINNKVQGVPSAYIKIQGLGLITKKGHQAGQAGPTCEVLSEVPLFPRGSQSHGLSVRRPLLVAGYCNSMHKTGRGLH